MALEGTASPVEAVLRFWFGDPATEATDYAARRQLWFGKKSQFDQEIADRFQSLYQQAAHGELDHWQEAPDSCLALLIVLDQFPRNLFRQHPQAFATDAKALAIAKSAIAQGFDQSLEPVQRIFMYLPLEHSEDRSDQLQSVECFRNLAAIDPALNDVFDYALRHYEVINRFGRFPHRNSILARPSTPEEIEFLKQPGSSF
ncbi:DUF924 family protein [Egbenema bharatensis]|uniref:DUF924 family protein n=1 Tax=Egbenema bharatensis TaxID=3463334 RepID=UPI003A8BA27F